MPKAKSAAAAPAEAAPTQCELYIKENAEVLGGFSLTITGRELAVLRVRSCRGPVRILTFIDREGGGAQRQIADSPDITDQWRSISLQAFATLVPGQNYVLTWVIDGPADDWQVVSELLLDDTIHYRHLKKQRVGVMNGEILMVKVRP
jgi:hypothetical protein